MNYYYIAFSSPIGDGAYFYRNEKHPLDPEMHKTKRESLATQLSLSGQGAMIHADSIVYVYIEKLTEEVAKARWPEDFK
jgi:hypothetical protein